MLDLWASLVSAAHYVIPFVIVLSVVVFAHEYGHFWVARRCGVRIDSFSIGFGPELFGWNDKHGTRWKVSALPLGGYVKMFGDSDPSSFKPDEEVVQMSDEEKKHAFFTQSLGKRMAIVAAGPVANYLFAILVLTGIYFVEGQPYTAPVVDTVLEDSAASRADLKTGDRILTIDGTSIESFETIKRLMAMNVGTPSHFEIEREGQKIEKDITPDVVATTDRLGGEHRLGRLGISSNAVAYRDLSAGLALKESVMEAWNLSASTVQAVGQMILGTRATDELGGPIRIAEMSGKMAKEGVSALIWFLAVLSVNLGLINLFPIPLLDGGHLVFYAAEGLRGRPLSEKAQEVGANIGLLFVASLMLFSTWNDLVHLRVVSFVRGLFS